MSPWWSKSNSCVSKVLSYKLIKIVTKKIGKSPWDWPFKKKKIKIVNCELAHEIKGKKTYPQHATSVSQRRKVPNKTKNNFFVHYDVFYPFLSVHQKTTSPLSANIIFAATGKFKDSDRLFFREL